MVTEEVESRDAHAPVKISVADMPMNRYSTAYAVVEVDQLTEQYVEVAMVTFSIWHAQASASLYNSTEIDESVRYKVIEVPFQHAG